MTFASCLRTETDLNKNKKHTELALMVLRQVIVLTGRGLTSAQKHIESWVIAPLCCTERVPGTSKSYHAG